MFGWAKSLPPRHFPCPPPYNYFLFLPLPLPSPLSLESRPLKYSYGVWERCKLPNGSEAERRANLVHFSLKIWHLVAPTLVICSCELTNIPRPIISGAKCTVAHPTKRLGGPHASATPTSCTTVNGCSRLIAVYGLMVAVGGICSSSSSNSSGGTVRSARLGQPSVVWRRALTVDKRSRRDAAACRAALTATVDRGDREFVSRPPPSTDRHSPAQLSINRLHVRRASLTLSQISSLKQSWVVLLHRTD